MEEENEIQPIRIGDISFGVSKSLGPKPKDYVDIFKFYPNHYYKRENDYIKEGEWFLPQNRGYRVHEDCFKNPECRYTVATIDIKEEPDVISVGLRPFELGSQDKADYEAIVRLAYPYAVQLWKKENNYF